MRIVYGFIGVFLFACDPTPDPSGPTYWRDARPVLEKRCAGCHQSGDIAPFALDDYNAVAGMSELVRDSIDSGRMPPWQAEDGCNDYANSTDLTADEKSMLLDWLDSGVPEGDPATATPLGEPAREFVPDVSLPLPEPVTPQGDDDYRCQIVELGVDHSQYVTGFSVQPDRRELVHHVIAFMVPGEQRSRFEAMDEAEPGPGYKCFGSPVAEGFGSDINLEDASIPELVEMLVSGEAIEALGGFGWLGSWAPGVGGGHFPNGTGIAVNPGDFLVVQMHYNTGSGEPVADQSSIALSFQDEVERPAMVVPYTDPAWVADLDWLGDPMTIPAGEPEVTHGTGMTVAGPLFTYVRNSLGLEADGDMLVHHLGSHMHTLGRRTSQSLVHADGTETCLVEIDNWDFDWQGGVSFVEPIRIQNGDELVMSCTWDNSPNNQPVIDGVLQDPINVQWGEGTRDEMCLGVLFLSAP